MTLMKKKLQSGSIVYCVGKAHSTEPTLLEAIPHSVLERDDILQTFILQNRLNTRKFRISFLDFKRNFKENPDVINGRIKS